MGREPCRWSSIGPRRGATSRARAGCKFVLSTLLATIALFAASTVSTHAQTDWTGPFSSNWFLSGNWIAGFPRQTTDGNINTVTPNATVISRARAHKPKSHRRRKPDRDAYNPGRRDIGRSARDDRQSTGRGGTVTVTGAGSSWTNVKTLWSAAWARAHL